MTEQERDFSSAVGLHLFLSQAREHQFLHWLPVAERARRSPIARRPPYGWVLFHRRGRPIL